MKQQICKPEGMSWEEAIYKNLDTQQAAIERMPDVVGLNSNLSLLVGLFRAHGFGAIVDAWELKEIRRRKA